MLTSKQISAVFGVKVIKIRDYWHAYRGGEGQPVVDVAKAYSLKTLIQRIQSHERISSS